MECRFCLKKSPKNNIYELKFKILHIIEEMLKISKEDEFPKLICNTCLTKVKTIEKFLRQCEESDAYFRNNTSVSIKHEPEFFTSEYENNTDSKTHVNHTEIQEEKFNDFRMKSRVDEIDKKDVKEILDCSYELKDEVSDDGLDVGEDNFVTNITNKKKSNNKKYKCKKLYKSHTKKEGKRLKCPKCPAKYYKKNLFEAHISLHDGITTTFTCQFCQMVHSSKKSCSTHILRCHKNDAPKIKSARKRKKDLDESGVNSKFSDSQLCPVCGKCFIDKRCLSRHIGTHSTDVYQCDVCSRTFNTKERIRSHMNKHSTARPYTCELCQRKFKSIHFRNCHMKRVHAANKQLFSCHICDKMLSSSGTLRRHVMIHTGEKTLQCDLCPKMFRGISDLTKHRVIHCDERPFACNYCPSTFKTIMYLKEHERLHTGETPYKCPVCLRGYAQRCNMKSHFKYNHRELNYKQEMERYQMALK